MEKPIKTVSISAGTRVYYLDVHVDSKGQQFIAISEVPTDKHPGKKKRQRIFLHANLIDKFANAFAEIVDHIKNES